MTVTLVLGGARSGKSAHAEGLLDGTRPATYVATARRDPADREFDARIARHIARRPGCWSTVETADLRELFASAGPADPPLLVDDLATWLTALLDETGAWESGDLARVRERIADTVRALGDCACDVVLVSAETGLGIVPATASGRLFRDELGALNAAVAEVSTEVKLLIAGIPLRLR
ncbi:bifunctional adenosylcobinamide kinase/adenosylcobinamide-phosphate guanylyltransferase [Sciscionella sediminilitoris]|uniref:bifunctional adenosylcobinamide kinase/adenosylcobinamide-phosphate guanylyltransferase n=1 Tax=Sciscionella sediminilitoris TaxID=1445613 RepID=UPI0004DEF67F|nr:bifunctional adenosylcobinamide kinase/adenosylcobinamide-phosphate guanylyltransferase [Sciscionella sp. SE31]